MSSRDIYQTLQDRNNPDEIRAKGPFCCSRDDAWLSGGFYFWESFPSNAHWWGSLNIENKKWEGYVICHATYDYDETKCFNLIDNANHIRELQKTAQILNKKKNIPLTTPVGKIISFLRTNVPTFNYEGCRANPPLTRNKNNNYSKVLTFGAGIQYIDLNPTIQICFFNKSGLNLKKYNIIHPDKYLDIVV